MRNGCALLVFAFGLLAAGPGAAQEMTRAPGVALPVSAALPVWPKPEPPMIGSDAFIVRSGDVELAHAPGVLGGLVVRVAGQSMAMGQTRPMLGYLSQGELKWVNLAEATNHQCAVRKMSGGFQVQFECLDPDGARWQIQRTFSPGQKPGTIEVETEVAASQDRDVAFLPMFMLFPGGGSFGPRKGQGLFAGVEYLEDEPSRSEADVVGPASQRQVPDSLKLTFPLMAIQSGERYLALSWQMRPQFAALFDSPDRLFGSGGHALGIIYPGAGPKERQDGSLLPRTTGKLSARGSLVLRAMLMGGMGKTVVPAIHQYVELHGLPPLPARAFRQADYISLATAGWLDSGIRESNRFHHAIAGGQFPAGPATDAAYWMEWLAEKSSDPDSAERLRTESKAALAAVSAAGLNYARVGHVGYPVGSLFYGQVAENAARAGEIGRQVLARFEPDGSIRYRPVPGGIDYSRTHYTNEANGLTSLSVLELLEVATVSGRRDLLAAGLRELRALDKFRDGVPRGAQTWECPLHTPDILASAHLVRAYTLGYELTGDAALLDQARYWAWTGVPFVYLVNPTDHPIGLYATIAVYGATHWKAPVWLGLPVQWCGLVYADALYRLVRDDPQGPWKTLADGITVSGIQQTWPVTNSSPDALPSPLSNNPELQGLLPDSFELRSQHRNGPAINPATVQACAAQYFGPAPIYDFWAFRGSGVLVHAPGRIAQPTEKSRRISFGVEPALGRAYYVLVTGLKKTPKLRLDGKPTACTAPHEYHEAEGWLVLSLTGKPRVELDL